MKFSIFEKLAIMILLKKYDVAIRGDYLFEIVREYPKCKIFTGTLIKYNTTKEKGVVIEKAPTKKNYQVKGFKNLFGVLL